MRYVATTDLFRRGIPAVLDLTFTRVGCCENDNFIRLPAFRQ
jgi:hypothetical protein